MIELDLSLQILYNLALTASTSGITCGEVTSVLFVSTRATQSTLDRLSGSNQVNYN